RVEAARTAETVRRRRDAQWVASGSRNIVEREHVTSTHACIAADEHLSAGPAPRARVLQRLFEGLRTVAVAQRARHERLVTRRAAVGLAQQDVPLLGSLLARGPEGDDADIGLHRIAWADVPRDELCSVAKRVIRRAALRRPEVHGAVTLG